MFVWVECIGLLGAKTSWAQGEVGEILIEKTLKYEFPIDNIVEVPKGQNGADISHFVKDSAENDLGLIYIESKYAKKFSSNWVTKLKEDMKNAKADFGILVTSDVPDNFRQYDILLEVINMDQNNILTE